MCVVMWRLFIVVVLYWAQDGTVCSFILNQIKHRTAKYHTLTCRVGTFFVSHPTSMHFYIRSIALLTTIRIRILITFNMLTCIPHQGMQQRQNPR